MTNDTTIGFIEVSIDELNQPKTLVKLQNDTQVSFTVTTNGYTKILRFESSGDKKTVP